MPYDLPSDTIRLLRAIFNQPDHTLTIDALDSLDIPFAKDRLAHLHKMKLIQYDDFRSNRDHQFSVVMPHKLLITAAGVDLLHSEDSVRNHLANAQREILRLKEKADYFEEKFNALQKSRYRRTALWSLLCSIVSALVSRLF